MVAFGDQQSKDLISFGIHWTEMKMPWHYPNDDEEEPVVISGTAATIIYYAAIWLFVSGLWKTFEVLAHIGGLLRWP